jgi:dienelactone hydrolase
MRLFILAFLMCLLSPALLCAQDKAQTPAPLLSPALCGKGIFLVSLSGSSIGRETFEVKCVEGGYAGSAKTDIKLPGATFDLQTTIELDKAAIPSKFTAKGTVVGSPIDQTLIFGDAVTTIKDGDKSQEIPSPKGSSFVMSNVPYTFMLAAARYDTARGGAQTFPLFPNLSMKIERVGRDEVQATGVAAAPKPVAFDRYKMELANAMFIVWADTQGRIVALSLPEQKYIAVREEYANFVEPLHTAIASTMKDLKPDYSAPPDAPFTAEEVTIKVKGYQLAGTLTLPKSGARPFPVVVTSTGSGAQTRDSPFPFPNLKTFRPFRQIAESLASRGIAVLRVDDRGVGDSTGLDTLDTATTLDFADDVRAQVAYLRTRREIDAGRIAILGHSEGGIIAPLVAASDPQIAAIVLLAGTGKRGDEIILYQMNRPVEINAAMPEEEKAKARAENQKIIRMALDGSDPSKLPMLLRFPWTKAFMLYDPIPTIRKVRQPILILQGALDQQVTADQAELLAKAARGAGNMDVTVRVFPNLNHLFLPAIKTGDESEYPLIEVQTLSDDVVKTIGDWLQFKLERSMPKPKR